MAELIALHSGKPLEQIQKDSERDRWFTADEAQSYGLVDKVIVRRGQIRTGRPRYRQPGRRGARPAAQAVVAVGAPGIVDGIGDVTGTVGVPICTFHSRSV